MTAISGVQRWSRAIAAFHKPAFIVLSCLTWASPPASLVLLSEGWTPLALILGPAFVFPPIGLMVVLSIVAVRHYHPLMWLSFLPVATTIFSFIWLDIPM